MKTSIRAWFLGDNRYKSAAPFIAEAHAAGVNITPEQLPDGVVLRRRYQGEWHEVYIVSTRSSPSLWRHYLRGGRWRYLYRGRRYQTLSGVAQTITGHPTRSGADFFGLWQPKRDKPLDPSEVKL